MDCLITGVAGFIGSSLARALVARGDSVRGVDDLATGRRQNLEGLEGRIDFRPISILDRNALAEACRGVECVFHQAAIPSVPRSVADPAGTSEVNVNGTLNVLIAARDAGVRRVLYAASSSAYGETPTLPKRESMTPDPISPYAVAKLAGEHFMRSFWRCYGLETVSLRYFNIFGPYQDPTSMYSAVFAKFISAMLGGEAPTIHGDGEQSRDFTYIENAVNANLRAAAAPAENVAGRMFNVATGRQVSLNEAFRLLKPLTGFAGEPVYDAARPGDVKHSLADIAEAERQFGYRVTVGLEEGLQRTVQWYREKIQPAPLAAI